MEFHEEGNSVHIALVRQVASSIGLCLLLYQDIEIGLKTLLPYMVLPKHANRTPDPFAEVADYFEAKKTLGPLLEGFKLNLTVQEPGEFSSYLRTVADHRNELVHRFQLRPEGRLATEDDCRIALAMLDERHRFARPLHALVRGQLQALLSIIS